MTFPALDLSAMILATHVTKLYSEFHHLAYAFIKPDLTVIACSPNFKAVLSDPNQPILGNHLSTLIWEFAGSEYAMASVFAGEQSHYELRQIHRTLENSITVYLDFYVKVIEDATLGSGLLLIVEDVTNTTEVEQVLMQERNDLRLTRLKLAQANEALEQVNRLKSLFVSMVAHDLRTPLTTIEGYTDILLRTAVADRSDDYLLIIANQTKRLDRLIQDLLDIDQIEQGKLKFNLKPGDLNDLVTETIESLQINLTHKQASVRLNLGDLPETISMDAMRIRQVIYNLISNAIKYSPRQSQITISTKIDGKYAILSVMDTGYGMSEEQVAKLFQLYYRTEDAEASDIEGTGLGLFIVKTFVDAHGGQIEVSSKKGSGTTFTVYLPTK